MAKSEKKKEVSAREELLGLARERFADRTFADLDATEPQEGVADLDAAIKEMLDEYATKQSAYDEKNSRLTQLLMSDPSAAEFMQKWTETGDPRTALVETFGDELGISEEGREKFKAQLDGWRERKAANDALEAEAQQNWENSLSALEEWGNAKGVSFEDKRDVMLRLLAITFNGMENKYGPEDFDLAFNAIHHDTDVEAARVAGEVAGRNAKIATSRRERNVSGAMPPAAPGGQGGRMQEVSPKKKSFWGEVNNG